MQAARGPLSEEMVNRPADPVRSNSQTTPAQIWAALSPQQQHQVWRTLVQLCRQLWQSSQTEVNDEPQ